MGRLTDRDMEWLAWAARWRGVTCGQIAAWFDPDSKWLVKHVEKRVRVMREYGLLESSKPLADKNTVHSVTRAGLKSVDINHSGRRIVVGQLHHDLAVVDLATWLRHARGFRTFITEQEIRAADPIGTVRPKYAMVAGPGSGRKLTYPDLVSVHPEGLLGHEVELARKEKSRVEALMRTYIDSGRYSRVMYYAAPRVRGLIASAADHVNSGFEKRTVYVAGWEWEI